MRAFLEYPWIPPSLAAPAGISPSLKGQGGGSPCPRDRHRGEKRRFERAHRMCALDFPAKQDCAAGKCRLRRPESGEKRGNAAEIHLCPNGFQLSAESPGD